MDLKHAASPNVQLAHAVLKTKDPNSPVDQSEETHVYRAFDALSVSEYRLYKRRWIGLGALHDSKRFIRADRFRLVVMALLNMVSATNWIWFSAVAGASWCTSCCLLSFHFSPLLTASTQFGISLTQVNWLANSVNLIYLPSSIATPLVVQRWGIRTAVGRNPLSFQLSFSLFV